MKRLKMSWNTEGGHLVCRWIESEEKCEPSSVADRLRLSYNPGNQSTRPFAWPNQVVFGFGRVV
jgi:hypothetical protein